MFRSQDDHRPRFDRLAWSQLKIVFSEQIAQNHEDLQHRVIAPDTASRSAPEGQISEGRVHLLVRFGEALGVEDFGALPVAWRMVRAVHVDNDRRSPGYGDIPYAVVGDRPAVDHPKQSV